MWHHPVYRQNYCKRRTQSQRMRTRTTSLSLLGQCRGCVLSTSPVRQNSGPAYIHTPTSPCSCPHLNICLSGANTSGQYYY